MQVKYTTLFLFSALFMSCATESTDEAAVTGGEESQVEKQAPACSYTLGQSATSVYWTAFKHTDKVGVKGKMDSVVVTGTKTGSSPMDALENGKVLIYTASINSKDEGRDKKLREIYFGSMSNTAAIEGNLVSWKGSDEQGTCTFNLKMNDAEKPVTADYTVAGDVVQIRFTMEPTEWDADEAIAKLGEACAEKHTGKDGKTIFWPDVEILIEIALDKDCPDVH